MFCILAESLILMDALLALYLIKQCNGKAWLCEAGGAAAKGTTCRVQAERSWWWVESAGLGAPEGRGKDSSVH